MKFYLPTYLPTYRKVLSVFVLALMLISCSSFQEDVVKKKQLPSPEILAQNADFQDLFKATLSPKLAKNTEEHLHDLTAITTSLNQEYSFDTFEESEVRAILNQAFTITSSELTTQTGDSDKPTACQIACATALTFCLLSGPGALFCYEAYQQCLAFCGSANPN